MVNLAPVYFVADPPPSGPGADLKNWCVRQFEALQRQLNEVQAPGVSGLEARVDALEDRVAALEGRMNAVEAAVGERDMGRMIEELRTALRPPGLAEAVAQGVEAGLVQLASRPGALAAWWYPEPERCEVIAASGSIGADADWLLEAIGRDMHARGAHELGWTGPRPWELAARRLYERI